VPADQQAPSADVLEVESSRLDSKIKNICRGLLMRCCVPHRTQHRWGATLLVRVNKMIE
jgi:hypothetical protein